MSQGDIQDPTTYAGTLSFLRRTYTRDIADADVVVTGIPFDAATSGRPGARFGPRAIRAASVSLAELPGYPFGVDPLTTLAIADYGDCHLDYGYPTHVVERVEAHALVLDDQGQLALIHGSAHAHRALFAVGVGVAVGVVDQLGAGRGDARTGGGGHAAVQGEGADLSGGEVRGELVGGENERARGRAVATRSRGHNVGGATQASRRRYYGRHTPLPAAHTPRRTLTCGGTLAPLARRPATEKRGHSG